MLSWANLWLSCLHCGTMSSEQLFEASSSVWELILQHCPENEVEEIKRILGTSLIEQAIDLHDEVSLTGYTACYTDTWVLFLWGDKHVPLRWSVWIPFRAFRVSHMPVIGYIYCHCILLSMPSSPTTLLWSLWSWWCITWNLVTLCVHNIIIIMWGGFGWAILSLCPQRPLLSEACKGCKR